ncbi:MAG: metallophosphoesterase [Acidobacteriaceae bacterium]|nr:metallophosphoesterase [Acidobacteriaceae bacterium]
MSGFAGGQKRPRESRGTPITRRQFILGSGIAATGMVLYSGEIGRHRIEVAERAISIANLPDGFHGFRIAQLSDIHFDEYTEPFFLERAVRRINGLKPDLVLLTGDFVTQGAFNFMVVKHAPHRCAEILSSLSAPQIYAVLGNHDFAFGAVPVVQALTGARIPVLLNRHVPIERNGDRLWLCGIEDPGSSRPDLNAAVPADPDGPVILMSHSPDYVDTVVQHPRGPVIDLMLSGHTHGGQIRLPFFGALVLPPMGQKYVEGLFHVEQLQLYVNRGLGTVGMPFRLNCVPEITLFTLQPA